MKPILLINESPEPTKKRNVEIIKDSVFKDIDLLTHKHVDGSGIQDKVVRNAVSSDASEQVDASVLARYVEFRDSWLRRIMSHALAPRNIASATDHITLDNAKYVYELILPKEFDDNLILALTELIHRYLVWGALYDWYSQFGLQQAAVYDTTQLESDINDILRGPSIVKAPMQPFGPAKPY